MIYLKTFIICYIMKVFVVTKGIAYEGSDDLGVFDSLDLALELINKQLDDFHDKRGEWRKGGSGGNLFWNFYIDGKERSPYFEINEFELNKTEF